MPSISGNPIGRAVIGQSGGPTAVINQSLVALVKGLRSRTVIEGVYGMRHGVSGLVRDDLIRLDRMDDARLSTVASTPSAALGSTRDKPDAAYCEKIFEACERHRIRYFFYIGGNDSSDTLRIVSKMAREAGYELRCFHIPKTIDNDLPQSDHTPGYPSAAKFVIQAFMGDNLDNRALPGIKINVVMGRHAGWLTAASVLARQAVGDGPHLIYVPETNFNETQFIQRVEDVYKREGRCIVAVAEGIHNDQGIPILQATSELLEKDAHGNVQLSGTGALGDHLVKLIHSTLGKLRVRADTFGYLQRSFCGVVSEVDLQEARSCGYKAAQLAVDEENEGSVAIKRISNRPYESKIVRIDLDKVAAQTRTLDPEYIAEEGDISDTFRKYLTPLVGTLPRVGRLF